MSLQNLTLYPLFPEKQLVIMRLPIGLQLIAVASLVLLGTSHECSLLFRGKR